MMIDEKVIDKIEKFREIRTNMLDAIIKHEIREMKKGRPPTPGSMYHDESGQKIVTSTWLENVADEQLFTNIIIGKLIEYLRDSK